MSMAWVAVGTAVVGAGAAAYSANEASNTAKGTQAAALAQQERMYQQQREDLKTNLEPYRQIGLAALPEYQRIMSGEEMKMSPAGQWQLQQAAKYQARQEAARGMSGSGGAVVRAGELGQRAYAQDYNDQYNRIMQALGIGQNAATTTATGQASAAQMLGTQYGQYGQNMSNLQMDQGQTAANFYGGLGGVALKGAALYQQNQQPNASLFGTASPFTSRDNPRGLTPGQGL